MTERRLAAILSADVVGYSRLMAEDEAATIRTITAYRHEIAGLVGDHGGRVVDSPGDNVLAEFPSALSAVECAVEIQRVLKARNTGLPEHRRMEFRVGVHLGDVAVEGERIYGDGVNIAARLESLAAPGGICISASVHEQVRNKLRVGYDDLGDQTVKNIPDRVRVYRLVLEVEAPVSGIASRPTLRRLELLTIGVLAVAVVLFALERFSGVGEEPPRTTNQLSIAVLPFENVSRDPANEPFTIGIHDDLLTQISRIGSIKTISRTSVLKYRDTTKTIPEISAELGVATILEGGVQRSGDRIRINVQLVDGATDEHLWAGTYDRQLTAENLFGIQSEVANEVAQALRITLTAGEQRRLAMVSTANPATLDSYFVGKQLLEERTDDSLAAAVQYFEQVIELDPGFARAYSGLADAYMMLPEYSATVDLELVREKSVAAVTRAWALDPDIPEVLASMAWNRLIHDYDWAEAEGLLRTALEIQSNNTNALHWLSHVLSWQGHHEEALQWARQAVEVDPLSTLMKMNLAYIYMDAGDFHTAVGISADTRKRDPGYPELMGNLWLMYGRAGRSADAAEAIKIWAADTGRSVEAAGQVGSSFIRHQQTGEPVHLPADLLARAVFGSEDLAQVYALVGDGENALAALDRAVRERSGSRSALSMKVNPLYDFIRDDPRFVELLGQIGLQQ